MKENEERGWISSSQNMEMACEGGKKYKVWWGGVWVSHGVGMGVACVIIQRKVNTQPLYFTHSSWIRFYPQKRD